MQYRGNPKIKRRQYEYDTAVTTAVNKISVSGNKLIRISKMAGSCGSFRQLEDKPCSAEIINQKWSPKMDLLALVTADGEVWLQRLSWKRVWSISVSDTSRALLVSWRPDGKILAIAFNDGKIKLIDIENAECVHQAQVQTVPASLDWTEQQRNDAADIKDTRIFFEKSNLYLPSLSHLPKSTGALFSKEASQEESDDPKKLKSLSKELNVLIVGDICGKIYLFLYGIFLCAVVNTADSFEKQKQSDCQVISATVSNDLKALSVVVKTVVDSSDLQPVYLMLYETGLVSSRQRELGVVSKKVAEVTSLMEYFDNTLQAMSDAWEDILLEMGTKLTEFAAERVTAGSSVSSEFLTLLTRGVTSPELQSFLIHDLTEKGLKKLGNSIENSYTSIQNLAQKHLNCVTQSLLYHITEIHGMSRWTEQFGILGLSEHELQTTVTSLGSIMLKTQELVHVIETSLKSFKAFFQWLYYTILSLSDAEIPDFLKQRSHQDVMLVSDFIQDQLAVNSQGKFTLERVGQYFDSKPLSVKPPFGNNDWTQFVESHPRLRSSPLLIPNNATDSLMTLSIQLRKDVEKAFAAPVSAISRSITCWSYFQLFETTSSTASSVCVSQASIGCPASPVVAFPDDNQLCIVAFKANQHQLYFARVCVNGLSCDNEPVIYSFSDVKFYDEEYLSVLLQEGNLDNDAEEKPSILAQIRFNWLEDKNFCDVTQRKDLCITSISEVQPVNVGPKITHYRKLMGIRAKSLSVSGSRKVSCVLSSSRRHICLFEMDAEDEDIEDDIDNENVTECSEEQ